MSRALLVVDVQNDFCEGGSLAVAGGEHVAAAISRHADAAGAAYGAVVTTRDLHVDPGSHFSATPDFEHSWPPHCVAGTRGSDYSPHLRLARVDAEFTKGAHAAAYSGFEGTSAAPAADTGREVGLAEWLRGRGVDAVDVVGIATDHCVRATALDAVAEGFDTRVLLDLTAGVAPGTTAAALEQLRAAGAELVGEPVLRADA